MYLFPELPRCVCLLVAFLGLALAAKAAEADFEKGGWEVIPQEELDAVAPKIDKEANAEFTYRELKVNDDAGEATLFRFHNRAKIFTEAGVKEWDKIDLEYQTGWRVYAIKARVIYPDGTITHLSSDDIFTRQILKDGAFEGYAKSFSFPSLKPGCIVEYKWRQSRRFWIPSFFAELSDKYPTWKYNLEVNPYSGFASRIVPYNCYVKVDKNNGKYSLTRDYVQALANEPHMYPRKDFEPFVYMAYSIELDALMPEKYWAYRGGQLVDINKDFIRSKQKLVKQKAKEIFRDDMSNDEKLRAAYDFCATQLTNIDEYTEKYTEQEIEDLKKNESPNDTLKRGYGTRYDINGVFASLAQAAGFSAHLAYVENNREYTYRQNAAASFNLSDWVVAIRQGEKWRYFDPGSSFLPFEELNYQNVDGVTIQTDEKYYYMSQTPKEPDAYSKTVRLADLRLDESGDLEGKVDVQYKGFPGIDLKRSFVSMSPQEREKYVLENEWQGRLPRASISEFQMKGADAREEPLVISYRIKVPAYAEVLGDRLILKPSVFEVGKSPTFLDEKRRTNIAFRYRHTVQDKVKFELPEGFVLQEASTANVDFPGDAVARKSQLSQDRQSSTVEFLRQYDLKLLRIGGKYYEALKAEFDRVNEADARAVVFQRSSGVASSR